MSNYRQAEIYFDKMYYKNAIELYERVIEKDPGNTRARIRIADCYRLLKDTENAEKWYESVIHDKIDTINYYYYAQTLSSNQKYEDAHLWYSLYERFTPDDQRAGEKVRFIDQMEFYTRDSSLFEITELPINTIHSEFGAAFYKSGLVFLSAKDANQFIKYQPPTASESDESMLNLFYTRIDALGEFSKPTSFHKKINTSFHEGPMTFYNGEKNIIFTRSNYLGGKAGKSSDNKVKLMMVMAELDINRDIKKMIPFKYSDPEYSVGHPSISSDNRILYFSSDMPGGFGGNDIYMSYNENDQWTVPINLGPSINSKGDEMFPYVTADNTLYFASDGWGGFGGLDIFRAEGSGSRFSNAENLGFPLNSNKDDFSLIMEDGGRSGYISSNRPGGEGSDDIYKFEAKSFQIAGTVRELYYEEPIDVAEVTLLNKDGYPIDFKITDKNGHFHFDVPFDETFSFIASKPGHTLQDTVQYITYDKRIGRDSINIYLWKHELFATGTIYDHDSEQPMSDVKIKIHNLTDNVSDTSYSDPSGTYIFLLRRGKEYDITVSKPGFLPDSVRINTYTLLKGEIFNDLILEQQFLEKVFVFFDFNKTNVKPRYYNDLDIVVDALRKRPETVLTIGAHADSRGSVEYNQDLSNRRANETANYIVSKGISKSRIVTRGFGELLLLNRCVDGTDCQEIEHSKNRRSEIKVVYEGDQEIKEFLEMKVEQD